MSTTTQTLTYKDYLALPETMQRYEIIDGAFAMSPSPTVNHQWILLNLLRALDAHVRANRSGVVLCAPLDVVIGRDPLRTRQPDLLYISVERGGGAGGVDLRDMGVLEITPDLVVEIMSPGEARRKIGDKLGDYARIGVRECWLVSPEAQTVEVLRLSPEGTTTVGLFGMGAAVRPEVLSWLVLTVEEVFR